MKNFLLLVCLVFSYSSISAQCTGTEPIISQVAEGSSSNKTVEIYNPSAVAIDLSLYILERVANGNGAGSGTNIALSGMLAPGEVFVISNGSSEAAILAVSDQTSGSISHNGNDSYILKKAGTVIDSYGDANSSSTFGANTNMIRNLSGACPYDTTPEDAFDPTAYTSTPYTTGLPANLGVDIGVLPVELSFFDAKVKSNDISIFWATSIELNNSHFEIQHSTDNRTFTSLGKVEGAGNSDLNIDYNYTHATPANGINYYRLQQFDFDGQSEYSQIVSVRFGKDAGISVYPNPVQSEVVVTLEKEFTTNATAQIISQNGSILLTETLTAKSFTQTMNVNSLPAGVYVLRVVNGHEVHTERFVKK